jgi:hypothetical protein
MEKGCLSKTKRLKLFKISGNSINPIEFLVQDSGYLFFLCEAKKFKHRPKIISENKQTNKTKRQNEKKIQLDFFFKN